jgi:hypothetical protein
MIDGEERKYRRGGNNPNQERRRGMKENTKFFFEGN